MVFWLLLLAIFALLTLESAVWCRYERGKYRKESSYLDSENRGGTLSSKGESIPSSSPRRSIKQRIGTFADDCSFLLSKIMGYFPSHTVRMFYYRHVFCMQVGSDCVIHYGLEVRSPWKVKLGRGCIIGDRAILDGRSGLTLDDYVNLSTECWIWTLQHNVNSPVFSTENEDRPVYVGKRAWLSSRTTVLPGCNVAEGSVLAAGAVLTRSINEPFEIWGGIPAKRISIRNDNLIYDLGQGHHRMFI